MAFFGGVVAPPFEEGDVICLAEFLKQYEPRQLATEVEMRLLQELHDVNEFKYPWNILVARDAVNVSSFYLSFPPYRGYEVIEGTWVFRLDFPNNYPHVPPAVTCVSKVEGHQPLSLDDDEDHTVLLTDVLFKENELEWTPVITLKELMVILYKHFMETGSRRASDISERGRDVF